MYKKQHRDVGKILPESLCPPWPRIVGVVSQQETWEMLQGGECDLVELRLDALEESTRDLPLRSACPLPLLLTFRHVSEGGYDAVISEEQRVHRVRSLLTTATAIDWEIAQLDSAHELLQEARSLGIACVGSAHFWDETPSHDLLCALEEKALTAGFNVLKVAFTPHNTADVQRGLTWLVEAEHVLPVALMGMGELANESRSLYAANGSCLLYGYLGKKSTAPGQWSAAECRHFRLRNR